MLTKETCTKCRGTGKCPICGNLHNDFGPDYEGCRVCGSMNGHGVCPACRYMPEEIYEDVLKIRKKDPMYEID